MDYITVARAFWDGVPVGFATAVIVGAFVLGVRANLGVVRGLAWMLLVVGARLGAAVDPAKHLNAYRRW